MASVQDLVKQILLAAHPVGSYYWSSEASDPATLFGGTWERVKDRFLYAVGDGSAAGDTGGEATHTLSYSEMPYHSHHVRIYTNVADMSKGSGNAAVPKKDWSGWETDITERGVLAGTYLWQDGTFRSFGTLNNQTGAGDPMGFTEDAGSGAAHNNLPPYVRAYCWRRTA